MHGDGDATGYRAIVVLPPGAARRLIARGVAQLPAVERALREGLVVVALGTTNGYVAEELLGRGIERERFCAGYIGDRLASLPAERQATATGPTFSHLVFSTKVASDGRPINAAAILPSGSSSLYATFEFDRMKNGLQWTQVWAVDGKTVVSEQGAWDAGTSGRRVLQLSNPQGLPNGKYHLALAVKGEVAAEGEVVVGRQVDDTDTQISGQVVDQSSGRGISGALVIALRPGVKVQAFLQQQSSDMAYTSARTDSSGRFTFPQQLPKGQAYGLIVVARGFQDLAIEGALRIGSNAPEQAQLSAIALTPE